MNENLNPFLSIIIPVYNLEDRVKVCLNSLYNQSNADFEVVIVNDGSTDDSLHVISSFFDANKPNFKTKIYSTDNQGVGKARNHGIKESSGRYLYFLDGDDYIDEHFVETIKKTTEKNHNSEAIVFGYNEINEKGETKHYFDKYPKLNSIITGIELLKRISMQDSWVCTINIIYKSDVIKSTNRKYLDFKQGQDIHFNYINLLMINSIQLLDKELSYYFYRKTSTTNTLNFNRFDTFYMKVDLHKHLMNHSAKNDMEIVLQYNYRGILDSARQLYTRFLLGGIKINTLKSELSKRYPNLIKDYYSYLKTYSGPDKNKFQIFYWSYKLNISFIYLWIRKIYKKRFDESS